VLVVELAVIAAWAVAVLAWPRVLGKRWHRTNLHRDGLATGGIRLVSAVALIVLILLSRL
jgi:hypothetical protein